MRTISTIMWSDKPPSILNDLQRTVHTPRLTLTPMGPPKQITLTDDDSTSELPPLPSRSHKSFYLLRWSIDLKPSKPSAATTTAGEAHITLGISTPHPPFRKDSGLPDMDISPPTSTLSSTAHISLHIDPSHRGKGLSLESLKALLLDLFTVKPTHQQPSTPSLPSSTFTPSHASPLHIHDFFTQPGTLTRIIATIPPFCDAAENVLDRLGFTVTGHRTSCANEDVFALDEDNDETVKWTVWEVEKEEFLAKWVHVEDE
ncbi:hypothetical protein BC829DRAFT_441052 [Chytridium lagenaria]|nr:hypothetical protein BC829DRAFT_441052 [Chytridium lagenaria]